MPKATIAMLTGLGLAAFSAAAAATAGDLYADADHGVQLTVAEMERVLVGNTLSWPEGAGRHAQFIAAGGALRGLSATGERYTISWRFREYDNLFCEDTGDAASSGCVQLLRKGDRVSLRRKDGLVEFTATLEAGEPYQL